MGGEKNIAQFVFSCLNFTSPPQFHDYFVHVSNHYNTISSKDKLLRTPRVRTTKYGLNSVKYVGAINGVTSLWEFVNQIQLMVSKICFF